ncbi:hypothetical protein LSUE1_G010111, partial [Lachnellula suecica]
MLINILLGALALLTALGQSSPIARRDTDELYILSNCFNNHTHTSYADIFYYYPDFLPDYPEPHYAGRTISLTTAFTFHATIPSNATHAAVGTLVSLDVSFSSYAGPGAVYKADGKAFYEPSKYVICFAEYYARD